jgi:hypothetical protein
MRMLFLFALLILCKTPKCQTSSSHKQIDDIVNSINRTYDLLQYDTAVKLDPLNRMAKYSYGYDSRGNLLKAMQQISIDSVGSINLTLFYDSGKIVRVDSEVFLQDEMPQKRKVKTYWMGKEIIDIVSDHQLGMAADQELKFLALETDRIWTSVFLRLNMNKR